MGVLNWLERSLSKKSEEVPVIKREPDALIQSVIDKTKLGELRWKHHSSPLISRLGWVAPYLEGTNFVCINSHYSSGVDFYALYLYDEDGTHTLEVKNAHSDEVKLLYDIIEEQYRSSDEYKKVQDNLRKEREEREARRARVINALGVSSDAVL